MEFKGKIMLYCSTEAKGKQGFHNIYIMFWIVAVKLMSQNIIKMIVGPLRFNIDLCINFTFLRIWILRVMSMIMQFLL